MKDKFERLHPLGVTVAAGLAILGLPFGWAMAVLLVWILWAICELVVWAHELRVERRRHEIRQLIERELASVPAGAPIAAQFPRAWRPFLGDRRPLSVSRHATR